MKYLPIAFCLFTSTRGHFGRKDRFIETINTFQRYIPLSSFQTAIAHIKVSPGEAALAVDMGKHLDLKFNHIFNSLGEWTHGQDSHQKQYLRDMIRVYSAKEINAPYVLHVEDDWLVSPQEPLDDLLMDAVKLLERNPDIMSVRLPRYTNEPDRINNLVHKHGLDRRAEKLDQRFWLSNDFSMNPSLFRARDIRAAVLATTALNVPQHVEHGLGQVLARLFTTHPLPFAFFDSSVVRLGHIGTPEGQEDDLNQPLIAT